MKRVIIGVVGALLLIVVPQTAGAQFDLSGLTGPELEITLKPSHPEPGERVEATVNDYNSSLYGAAIAWQLDGAAIPDSANSRSAEFTAGALGETQQIAVTFTRQNGTTERVTTTVRPVHLDIILEAQTRTPQFYLGRSLPSVGSMINATALVSTGGAPQTTGLTYTWQVNQQVLENGPLRGGYKVSFPMPMGDSAVLSLQVSNSNNEVVAKRNILVPSVAPMIRFYEVSSLFGVNPIALGNNFTLTGNTGTLRAEPYHLDTRVFNDPAVIDWRINNRSSNTTANNPYEVTLQRTAGIGRTELSFQVRDTSQVLQGAKDRISITY